MSFWSAVLARRGYFLLALTVIAMDQASKILADHFLRALGTVEVVPGFFNLWYSRNRGGLFGLFRDWGGIWRGLLLTLLPIVAIVLIAVFLARTRDADRPTLTGLGLILGGAVGNLIDRLFRGEVIDFLDVYVASAALADRLVSWFGTAHWPTFNVADSSIVVGAGLLVLSMFRPGQQVAQPPAAKPQGPL